MQICGFASAKYMVTLSTRQNGFETAETIQRKMCSAKCDHICAVWYSYSIAMPEYCFITTVYCCN